MIGWEFPPIASVHWWSVTLLVYHWSAALSVILHWCEPVGWVFNGGKWRRGVHEWSKHGPVGDMRAPELALHGCALALLLLGLRELLLGFEENRCSMTYMFEHPEYRVRPSTYSIWEPPHTPGPTHLTTYSHIWEHPHTRLRTTTHLTTAWQTWELTHTQPTHTHTPENCHTSDDTHVPTHA